MSRTLRLCLAFLWTLGIFVATNVPSSTVPDVDADNIDKYIHFAMFFGFGWLWMWAIRPPLYRRFLYVAAAGVLIAVGTEVLQGLMPLDRQANFWDVVANLAGLFSAMGLYLAWVRLQKEKVTTS